MSWLGPGLGADGWTRSPCPEPSLGLRPAQRLAYRWSSAWRRGPPEWASCRQVVLHCRGHWADRRADSETKVWCSIASPDAWGEVGCDRHAARGVARHLRSIHAMRCVEQKIERFQGLGWDVSKCLRQHSSGSGDATSGSGRQVFDFMAERRSGIGDLVGHPMRCGFSPKRLGVNESGRAAVRASRLAASARSGFRPPKHRTATGDSERCTAPATGAC